MSCETVRQFLLDSDWDAGKRRAVAELLQHAEQCAACKSALDEYDAIQRACAPVADDSVPAPEGGWDAMERRLAAVAEPAKDSNADAADSAGEPAPFRLRHVWLRPMLAMAAAVLLAFAGFAGFELRGVLNHPADLAKGPGSGSSSGSDGRSTTRNNPPDVSPETDTKHSVIPVMAYSKPVVSQAVRQFCEVSRRVHSRAAWMLVFSEGSAVGVVPDDEPLTRNAALLHLTLMHGSQSVSKADVMVRAGQEADFTLDLSADQSLRYKIGTSADEPGHLSLWLELKPPYGGESLATLSTTLNVNPGKQLTALKLLTSAGEYELNIEFASTELTEDP